MRSTRALFSTLLALALATAACSDDSVSPSQPGGQEDQDQQPGSVTTSGPIRSLGGTTSGLTVVAGLNTGEISGTSYSIDLNENAVQMVSVVNEQGQPVLLSVALVGTTSSQLAIDARSTAATLVFLNPFLVTSDAGEAAEALALVQALPSFNALVAEIDRQLAAGTFVVDAGNPALDSALSDVFFDLQEVFATAPGSPLGLEPARVDLDPGFAVN